MVGVVDLFMVAAGLLQLTSYVQQYKFNKAKKSVYGLSYDYIFITCVGYWTNLLSCLQYVTDPSVKSQYRLRNPVYPDALVVSWQLFLVDCMCFGMMNLLLIQLVKYKKTINTNQGLSVLLKGLFFCFVLIYVKIIKNSIFHQNSINFLDLVDFMWLIAKVCRAIALIPQINMNWFDDCIAGTFDGFLTVEMLKNFALLAGKLYNHYSEEYSWWSVPVNFEAWPSLITNLIATVAFYYQCYAYRGARPTLRRKYQLIGSV